MKKTCCSLIIVTLLILTMFGNVYAETPGDIRQSVEADFQNYIPSLNQTKKEFGLSDSDDFSKAILEEGHPYYRIAPQEKLSVASNVKDSLTFAGYIFPVSINLKPAGLLFADNAKGQWKVLKISSDLDFASNYKLVNEKFKSQKSKIIYDETLHISGVVDEDTSNFGALRPNPELGLTKSSITPFSELKKEVAKIRSKKQNSLTAPDGATYAGGGHGDQPVKAVANTNHPLILTLSVVTIALALCVFAILRKRKLQK
ncbi:hypothetical protein [Paenibacillus caui]|uniref:hypothetical protein n=1 Tax=Paenibacillus caui TaxID=2873927 RepID=UPI001CA82DC5|nr:hypothetical protein [Paenibacillus caui]